MSNIGEKQSEMLQIASKYRLPSGFKNDSIGVWYDTKTLVTQTFSKLKQFISEKGVAVNAQTMRP